MRWLCLGWVLLATIAYARAPARDPAHEARYAEALAKVDPALVASFQAATADMDAERWDKAREGFAQILVAAPDHAPSMRRLAFVLSTQHRSRKAIEWARKAAADKSDPLNQLNLAMILAEQSDRSQRNEALDIARAVFSADHSEDMALAYGSVALRAGNLSALREAVDVLERVHSKNPGAKLFLAIVRGSEEEWSQADAALDEAVALGLPQAEADRLRAQMGLDEHLATWRYVKLAGLVLGAWLLGLGLIYVVGRLLSGRTLAAIERHIANPEGLVAGTQGLRRAYAIAIGAAAAYYFVSIPILLAVVIGGAGAILWGIWAIGYIPIKLVVLIAIGVLVTVSAVLRSLFVRRPPPEDPGRPILPEQAPKLWEVLREVAGKVGTRPVDKVFLTMGTDMAVTERGSLSARLRDQGERILIIGAGLLAGMTISELKAVLAHEYGHFSNRDTAGGDVAMKVNASLLATAIGLAESGVSTLNPVWQFLKLYGGLFARVTQGASRLQEVLADRFAALLYGPTAFAGGLTAAVRRSILFDAEVGEQVRLVAQDKQPIKNLYAPPALPSERILGLEEQVREAMNVSSDFDSHPAPSKRIELVRRTPEPPAAAEVDDESWSLLPNRAELEAAFTWKANAQLRGQGVLPPEDGQSFAL